VIGGGVVGTSVAYHLAKLGWTDLVLLEQGRLSSGTTWHAAGLVGQLRSTQGGTRLVQYSAALYEGLEAETSLSTGFKRCGGVTVARTHDRLVQLKRTAATAVAFGLECELISPARAAELYPVLRTDDLLGALWLPGDGTVTPTDLTQSLARGARDRGARIIEQARVTGISTRDGAVTGVTVTLPAVTYPHSTDASNITDDPTYHIEAEVVVNCAGQWAKAVGAMCGVTVPLHSAEHFYVVTEPIVGVHRMLPILRDPDGYTYFKEEVGGLVVGGFEPQAKPWVSPDELPYPFEFQLLGEDWEHFSVLMESALHRIPALEETGIRKFYNGPESFTPDNQFILGAAPEARNFYVAAGFNSVGIATGGGAGRALAEWIVAGEPQSDLAAVDIRRFAPFHGNNQWLRARVGEVLGLHYEVPWPNRELESARPFRRSPVHDALAAAGASFGSKMGWERANYFAPPPASPQLSYTWGKPDWLALSRAEQLATRNAVAVFDQTSFGKLLIEGRDAADVLQWLCSADVDVAPGRAVYTALLNQRGGYEADVTVTRVGRDSFLLVTSAGSVVRDQDWIARHIRRDQRAAVVDVTAAHAVLSVMGPRSRELLARLTRADMSDAAFPHRASRLIDLGPATVRATRITYVGELGWELYVPAEFAAGVFAALHDAGADLGVANAGYYAINSLRLEKAYRAWGAELTPDNTPVEAGLLFQCKLSSGRDFLGREAVEKARADGPRQRLVSLVLADPDVMMWGGELVLRDGVPVGQVTSAAWGATLGACVALAYLTRPGGGTVTGDFLGGRYELNVGGTMVPASASLRAPCDPPVPR
jgi:4-methylaminobutanoate oxidase (formaldehyde-forming)